MRVLVTPEYITIFLKNACLKLKIESDLPESAKFITAHLSKTENVFYFLFEHESFDYVKPGEIIPVLNPPSIHIKHTHFIEHNGIHEQ